MKIKVLNKDGSESGRQAEFDDALFGAEPKDNLIYEDIRSFLANQRKGTASTKGRSEVRGGGRKAYRQKGTGMARRGSIRSPLLKGGGTVFGPKPRKYSVGLTKKMKRLARLSAMIYKLNDNAVKVIEDFDFETPKTKAAVEILKATGVDRKKVLVLTSGTKPVVYKSCSNLQNVKVLQANSSSTYHLTNADVVLMQESAVKEFEESLKGKTAEAEA